MASVTEGTYEPFTKIGYVVMTLSMTADDVADLDVYDDPGSALADARQDTARDGAERHIKQVKVTSQVYAVVRR